MIAGSRSRPWFAMDDEHNDVEANQDVPRLVDRLPAAARRDRAGILRVARAAPSVGRESGETGDMRNNGKHVFYSVRPTVVVPRGCGHVPPMGRAGIRPAPIRHGHVPDERKGPLPVDKGRPGGEVPGRGRCVAQCALDASQGL